MLAKFRDRNYRECLSSSFFDPGPQPDGAADATVDPHLWEYADRTEKTGWQS